MTVSPRGDLAGVADVLGDEDAVVDDPVVGVRPLSHIRALNGVTCTSSEPGSSTPVPLVRGVGSWGGSCSR